MNKKITINLSTIENLYFHREKMAKEMIGNLSLNAVKEDVNFKNTVSRIINQTILEPVTIGQPELKGHTEETRKVSPNYEMMLGGQQTIQIVTVAFPVTGNSELFDYRSNGGILEMGAIYTPIGRSITIEVELPALDKAKVLSEATDRINLTRTLIAANNPSAQAWSQRISTQIEELANQRRKELLDFYS